MAHFAHPIGSLYSVRMGAGMRNLSLRTSRSGFMVWTLAPQYDMEPEWMTYAVLSSNLALGIIKAYGTDKPSSQSDGPTQRRSPDQSMG